jgi:acetyltransferase-like isoleucine patch superfamily enzyme
MEKAIPSPIGLSAEEEIILQLDDSAIIDEGVTLGYQPSRAVNQFLIIGPGARIRQGTIIYRGSRIGANLETGHNVLIREENEIGDDFRIWNNSVIDYGCRIGNNVKIHNKVYIGQFSTIEDDVFIAPGATFANDMHPGCPNSHECMRGPHIKRGAQIGINSTLLPKVVVGERSLIGAGSVVTKDVPAGVVVYGNPARVICKIEDLSCSSGLRDKPYPNVIFGGMNDYTNG